MNKKKIDNHNEQASASRQSGSRERQHNQRGELTWATTIAHTRRHWWWYLVIGWVGLCFVSGFVVLENWPLVALIVVMTLALIVTNLGKPREWTVTITKDLVVRERRRSRRPFREEFPLARYKSFTLSDLASPRHGQSSTPFVVLLPVKRFQLEAFLFLPDDQEEIDRVLRELPSYVPYDEAPRYNRDERILNRLARWVGLA